jgi:HD-like signal output (HDOD) protein
MPIRSSTALELERMRADQDAVDAHMLTDVIQGDPFMMVKLLAHAARLRRPGQDTDTETITSTLVLMGIAPFFRTFGPQQTIKDWLHDQPRALDGLRHLMQRAYRASRFALGFAVHRGDPDVELIQLAAFLYDFPEMLMWCHAPTLQQRIREAQRADPTLRSASIQREVLNMELDDLRQNLLKLWHMPELLVRISDNRHTDLPIVRNVVLAQRLARHTMQGWDNPAVPDDIDGIAKLLNCLPRVAMAYVHKIDQPPE